MTSSSSLRGPFRVKGHELGCLVRAGVIGNGAMQSTTCRGLFRLSAHVLFSFQGEPELYFSWSARAERCVSGAETVRAAPPTVASVGLWPSPRTDTETLKRAFPIVSYAPAWQERLRGPARGHRVGTWAPNELGLELPAQPWHDGGIRSSIPLLSSARRLQGENPGALLDSLGEHRPSVSEKCGNFADVAR